MTAAGFTSAFPILASPDLGRALGFYRDLLGGVVEYRFPDGGDPQFVLLAIGTSRLGLGRSEPTPPVPDGPEGRIALWVYAEDCDAAVDRLAAAGTEVVEPPTDQPWGERVARVRDPDGNLVVIGSPPG